MTLLRVEGLRTWFPIREGVLRRTAGYVKAVDGVDLAIGPGETAQSATPASRSSSRTAKVKPRRPHFEAQ